MRIGSAKSAQYSAIRAEFAEAELSMIVELTMIAAARLRGLDGVPSGNNKLNKVPTGTLSSSQIGRVAAGIFWRPARLAA